MKAKAKDKIRIVNKMSDWCMDYKEGDVFTVESTWYGGVNVVSKSGVPISLDEVEYEIIGQEKAAEDGHEWKVMIHADSANRLEQAMSYAEDILEACREKDTLAEIEILANLGAVKGLQTEFADREKICDLCAQGVKFAVCEKSACELGIKTAELVSDVKTVACGAVELLQKQLQGFAYIKA